MNGSRLTVAMFVFLFFYSSLVLAATYVTDSTASSANTACSEASPCNTIQKSLNKHTATSQCDNILVKNGTYNQALSTTIGGSSELCRLTITNYPGHSPIIDGTSISGNGVCLFCNADVPSERISYVTFSGFEVRNWSLGGGSAIKYTNADHMIIENNHIHDNLAGAGVLGGGVSSIIRNNRIHSNGPSVEPYNHGLYMTGSNNQYYNNLIWNNQGYAIQLRGQNFANHPGYPSASYANTENNLIANNVMAYQLGSGMNTWRAETGASANNNLIYSNIFFQNARRSGSSTCGINFFSSSGHNVRRNVQFCSGTASSSFSTSTCTSCTITSNYGGTGANLSMTNPAMQTAPLTFAGTPDFHLTTGSVAIDFGLNLYSLGITTDFDGIARPSNPALSFETGAYEFGADTTPPEPPTGVSIQ
jgi:hypothetical protein